MVHVLGVVALLDDRGHESGKLRLLPALLVRQLDMDEVEPLKGMISDDAAEHVDAALLTGVALDRR